MGSYYVRKKEEEARMKALFWSNLLRLGGLFLILTACSPFPTQTSKPLAGSNVVVSGVQWGQSTCYIGATEGSSGFNIADLQDLGINTYHIYGGMSRWEPQDDSRVYGSPSIAQIKANPNVINWDQWDKVMTDPPDGSDYWWLSASPSWQGNARTLFASLKAAGIQPLITLRNLDDQQRPAWAPNPPTTQADWNEWWEHVFATVYWLNVRNNYNINDFEVQNEPDYNLNGWTGTQAQYITFLQYTHDAVDYVYKTYLHGQTYHLYAPGTTTGSSWPYAILQQSATAFDSLDIHAYGQDITKYVRQAHSWLNWLGRAKYPVWITEWGSYGQEDKYSSVPTGVSLINNLIRGSRPGDDYVYGSDLYALYDYGSTPFGLISSDGTRRVGYYTMRMAIRALQGCRPTYQSTTKDASLLAITTKDANGSIYFLVTNQNSQKNYKANVDLSALITQGKGTIWQFDADHSDQIVGDAMISNGQMTLTVPAMGGLLVKF
jgi:hypothetical protein